MSNETIEVLTREGKPWRCNRAKFEAMRAALLAVLPDRPTGMTVAEAKAALLPTLDPGLFPDGAKAMWWIKAVQLDQEARGIVAREEGSPVRLYKVQSAG